MKPGGYRTSQRMAILDCLRANSDVTVSADDIMKMLIESGAKANIATVYRNLERLYHENLVLRFPAEDGSKYCYQLARDEHCCQGHLHLKCSECGKVIHLDCDFMGKLADHIRGEHGFSMNFENSIIYGLCDDCRMGKRDS
ncbi:MAG: Fur family transcriptional regulator [Sphaerochaetaceae bacterium]